MYRLAVRAAFDLVAAGRAIGNEDRVGICRARGRQEGQFAHRA